MKKSTQHPIAEVPRRQTRTELTVGIDLGDVWSHYCTLNEAGEVIAILAYVHVEVSPEIMILSSASLTPATHTFEVC